METKEKLSKKQKIGIIILVFLIVLSVVGSIYILVVGGNDYETVSNKTEVTFNTIKEENPTYLTDVDGQAIKGSGAIQVDGDKVKIRVPTRSAVVYPDVYFKIGEEKGLALIENGIKSDKDTVSQAKLYNDKNELVAVSPAIEPGSYIDEIKLLKPIEIGIYKDYYIQIEIYNSQTKQRISKGDTIPHVTVHVAKEFPDLVVKSIENAKTITQTNNN